MQYLPLILSLARYGLMGLGSYFVTKGYIDNDVLTALAGVVPSVISLVSSVLTHAPVKTSDVITTISDVATAAQTITKDGQTKEVLGQIKVLLNSIPDDLLDKAKGNI